MNRVLTALIGVGIVAAGANAGTIYTIGQDTGTTAGLASVFLTGTTANGANGCLNVGPTGTNLGCVGTTSLTNFRKLNYANNLFSGPSTTTVLNGPNPLPNQAAAASTTISGGGATFQLIEDGLSTTSSNGVANFV